MKKTVSIPDDLQKFLDDNPELSPSKMLQSKIMEIKSMKEVSLRETMQLKKQVDFLQEKVYDHAEKIVELKEKIKLLEKKIDVLEKQKHKHTRVFGIKKRS